MVEWKKLGEIGDFLKGRSLSKNDIGLGDSQIILYGELYTTYSDYITSIKSKTSSEKASEATLLKFDDIVLPVSSTTKEAQIGKASVIKIKSGVYLGSDAIIIRNTFNPDFLMYYLNSKTFEKNKMDCVQGTTIMHLSPNRLAQKLVPVPSIAEQNKIVDILDSFSSSIENLKQQITERRSQYLYYRDRLFEFEEKESVEIQKLHLIAEIGTGSSNTQDELDNGRYPFFVRSQIVRWKNDYEFDETAIITSGDGVGVGKVLHYIEGKYALHQRAYRIHITSEKVFPKYFYYYMQKTFYKYIMSNAYSSSVTSVRRPMLLNYPVPIPSLTEQKHIVTVLETFESSIKDLEAQLELRQKQYEYYREKLLTFE